MKYAILSRLVLLLVCSFGAFEEVIAETVVTTYVTTVQEERRSTRWTLTEWLRIKERMKLMDVWLAMFSDPKTDQFHLELNLIGGRSRGALAYHAADASEDDHGTTTGDFGRVQLWLTNIFTGSTGLRLLNVDFGLEAGFRHSLYSAQDDAVPYFHRRDILNSMYTANFRIFGKNIQDSSLVLKAGQYRSRNSVPNLGVVNSRDTRKGLLLGSELQLYLFRWLGAEGSFAEFRPSDQAADGWTAEGFYYDYGGYAEVSLLRLMIGRYHEQWQHTKDDAKTRTNEDGLYAGAKLQF